MNQSIDEFLDSIEKVEDIIKNRSSYSGFSLYLYTTLILGGFSLIKKFYNIDTENYFPSLLISSLLFTFFYVYVLQGNFIVKHKYIFRTRSNFRNYNFRGLRTVLVLMTIHFTICAIVSGVTIYFYSVGMVIYLLLLFTVTVQIHLNADRKNIMIILRRNKFLRYLNQIPFSITRKENDQIYESSLFEDRTYRPYGYLLLLFFVASLVVLTTTTLPRIDYQDFWTNIYVSIGSVIIYAGIVGIFYDLAVRDILNVISSIRLKVIASQLDGEVHDPDLVNTMKKIIVGKSVAEYIFSETNNLNLWLLVKYEFLHERFINTSLIPKKIRFKIISWQYRRFRKRLFKRLKRVSRDFTENEKKVVNNKIDRVLQPYDRYWLLTITKKY